MPNLILLALLLARPSSAQDKYATINQNESPVNLIYHAFSQLYDRVAKGSAVRLIGVRQPASTYDGTGYYIFRVGNTHYVGVQYDPRRGKADSVVNFAYNTDLKRVLAAFDLNWTSFSPPPQPLTNYAPDFLNSNVFLVKRYDYATVQETPAPANANLVFYRGSDPATIPANATNRLSPNILTPVVNTGSYLYYDQTSQTMTQVTPGSGGYRVDATGKPIGSPGLSFPSTSGGTSSSTTTIPNPSYFPVQTNPTIPIITQPVIPQPDAGTILIPINPGLDYTPSTGNG